MGEVKKSSERPYLNELGVFSREVARMRDEALHTRQILLDEMTMLEAEIAGRRIRITEQEEIVARCDAAIQPAAGAMEQATEGSGDWRRALEENLAENEATDLGSPDHEETNSRGELR